MRGEWDRAMATDTDDLRWVTNWALPLFGRTAEAVAAYRSLEQRGLPAGILLMMKGSREVLENRRADAIETIRLFTSRPFDPEGLYFMARGLVRLGERSPGLDLLERVVDGGFFCPQILLCDPWLDEVRTDPRFTRVVERATERSQDAEAEFHRLGGDQLLATG
jgi:hypothetical protein